MGVPIKLRVASSQEAIILQSASGSLAVEAVSPRVTLERVSGGTQMSVTDIDGTHTAVIHDGQDGATGPIGPSGATGPAGIGIVSCELLQDYRLMITYSNGVYDIVGPIRGAQGEIGPIGPSGTQGPSGVGIAYCELLQDYRLMITYSNGTYDIVGPIRGPQGEIGPVGPSGAPGQAGVGIAYCELLQDYRLMITYTNGTYDIVGPIRGAQGESGAMVSETVSGTDPVIVGEDNHRYVCGTVDTLTFTPPASGIVDVVFASGTTPTVLIVPNTVKWPGWFDPANLDASTTYEINIMDGVYGAVAAWI